MRTSKSVVLALLISIAAFASEAPERVVVRGRGVHVVVTRGPLSELGAEARPIDPAHRSLPPSTEVLLLRGAFSSGYVPVLDNDAWLRPLTDAGRARRILEEELHVPLEDAPEPTEDRIRRGEIDDLVQMYRLLRTRAGERDLSNREQGMLRRVEHLLVDELAAVLKADHEQMRARLPQWPAFTEHCHALMQSVADGAEPLSTLMDSKCPRRATTWAVLNAKTSPDSSRLVRTTRSGDAVVPDDFMPSRRITWQGECLAHLEEAVPSRAQPQPPSACLDNAVIRERDHRAPLTRENARAGFLLAKESGALQGAWRECWTRKTNIAEGCLEALLPLEQRVPLHRDEDEEVARLQQRWLEVRPSEEDAPAHNDFEARCRLALYDATTGALAFRCSGSLAEALCNATFTVSLETDRGRACAPDRREVVILASLGTAPPETCRRAVREAMGAPKRTFAQARRRAFDACWQDEAPDDHGPGLEGTASYETKWRDEHSVPPSTRTLLQGLLARQESLFGTLKLPPACERGRKGCVVMETDVLGGDEIGRVVAKGCGHAVWAVNALDDGAAFGGGSWMKWDGSWLTRLGEGERLREPDESDFNLARVTPSRPPFAIRNTLRQGNIFRSHRGPGTPQTHDSVGRRYRTLEAELIEATCTEAGFEHDLCTRYARGGELGPIRGTRGEPIQRMRAHVDREWPRASRRLRQWQKDLANGTRLDALSGESVRETCHPVLIDACTGDVAERCTAAGRDAPDDTWRFGRLPRLRPPP